MLELAQSQRLAGEQVIVFSAGTEQKRAEHHNVTIRYLEGSRMEFAMNFVRDVTPLSPHVIHVHNRAEIAWLSRAAGLGPTILSCDYHLEPWHRFPCRGLSKRVWRRCLFACDRIAPVSRYCSQLYASYWSIPQSKLAEIPNGVDCRRFRPDNALRSAWRTRLGVGSVPVILYVGRLCRQKGSDLLIEAYRQLKSQAVLVMAGPCEQFGRDQTSSLVSDLQEAGGIYLPPLEDDELPGLYNACDVFAMPTRELEMFGMAAVEAQACGKPVVASDHGGLQETVPDTAGVRFEAGSAADLAMRLEQLLGSDRPLETLAAGARENALRYDWPIVAERCRAVYESL